ncbi:hypothetical protein [Paraburkholderia hospita]|uniref:hypothetical protein n=1 Tax=Paraburkholderia hospita TaxID=169430 RepID=UPI001EE64A20|nr:hypothetical protein [Paraburkholderia hospita]
MAALYEHSIFTQGTSLNIDSFDQCGVELGNMLAPRIAPQTRERERDRARARQLEQHADPALPPSPRDAIMSGGHAWILLWKQVPWQASPHHRWC